MLSYASDYSHVSKCTKTVTLHSPCYALCVEIFFATPYRLSLYHVCYSSDKTYLMQLYGSVVSWFCARGVSPSSRYPTARLLPRKLKGYVWIMLPSCALVIPVQNLLVSRTTFFVLVFYMNYSVPAVQCSMLCCAVQKCCNYTSGHP